MGKILEIRVKITSGGKYRLREKINDEGLVAESSHVRNTFNLLDAKINKGWQTLQLDEKLAG